VIYAGHVETHGVELFETVCERNIEGIVAKHKYGAYNVRARWLKIKNPKYTQTIGRREMLDSFHERQTKRGKVRGSLFLFLISAAR
jgi:ATP-dependent DNA ligase